LHSPPFVLELEFNGPFVLDVPAPLPPGVAVPTFLKNKFEAF